MRVCAPGPAHTHDRLTKAMVLDMNTRQVRGFLFLALGALVLAAWTGVLMRVGMVNGFPSWAQNYGAIRHAHSHRRLRRRRRCVCACVVPLEVPQQAPREDWPQ